MLITNIGVRHDRLLDLVEDIADEDPIAALRLRQVCGVNRFGHLISAVPPHQIQDFATARDDAITFTFATIQQEPPSPDSTHSLPVGAGGTSLKSLACHAFGNHLGAFFRVASPLQR